MSAGGPAARGPARAPGEPAAADPGGALPGGGSLFAFDDGACERLAREQATPFFAYSARVAGGAYDGLRAALPARVRIAYAVKANPHPALLACLLERGAGFDCASRGELDAVDAVARAAGARPALFYAGPGKRLDELERARELGARIQAEGWEDLERLEALAGRDGVVEDVNLRVHPLAGVEEERRILGGSGPSAFGVDEEHVPALLARAAALRHVRVTGLHVFAASNRRDAAGLLATWGMVLRLARQLGEGHGLELAQVDLGGGLGVPYAAGETPLDLAELGAGLRALLAEQAWFRGELVVEPGRFLAAGCGVYVARVVRTKDSRGTRFVVLEGGLNHLLRPLLTGQPFPVRVVAADGGREEIARRALREVTLTGPLCTSLDRLGTLTLPDPRAGDLLAFGMTGAYGATEAMERFLSHPRAPEIWVEE